MRLGARWRICATSYCGRLMRVWWEYGGWAGEGREW